MREVVIHAEPRTESGSRACRHLRRKGMVPGVVSGHGEAGIGIAMDAHDLLLTLHTGAHMFDLKVKGRPDEKVLVKELQDHSLGDTIIHVDLQRIALTEVVEVTVPIVMTGHAIGAVHHGIVDQPLKELDIVCLPTDIPDDVRVHVTELDIGDMLTVKDIQLPDGVTTTNAPEQVVVTVHPPVTEEEAEAAEVAVEDEAAAEPEVIGGRPEGETEEAQPGGKAEK